MDRSLYAGDRVCVEPSAGVEGGDFSDGGSWKPHALAKYSDIVETMVRYLLNFTILGHDPRASPGGVEPWRVPGGCVGTYSTLTRALRSTSGTLMGWTQVPSCETVVSVPIPPPVWKIEHYSLFARFHTFCLIDAIASAARVRNQVYPSPYSGPFCPVEPVDFMVCAHLPVICMHAQLSCVHSAFARRGTQASLQLIKCCRPKTLEFFIRSCQVHDTMSPASFTISK